MTDESDGRRDGGDTAASGASSGGRGDGPVNITLVGDRGEQFERVKRVLADNLGYEPNNPEVMGLLMSAFGGGSDTDSNRDRGR